MNAVVAAIAAQIFSYRSIEDVLQQPGYPAFCEKSLDLRQTVSGSLILDAMRAQACIRPSW